MKSLVVILSLGFLAGSTWAADLAAELSEQQALVQKHVPGAYLFEATAYLEGSEQPLARVQGRFAIPKNQLSFWSVWTTNIPGHEHQEPVPQHYNIPQSGIPIAHPRPIPERELAHLPFGEVTITFEQLRGLTDASWRSPVANLTTLGRLRAHGTLINLAPFANLNDDQPLVVLAESVNIGETARYFVIDGRNGAVLGSGSYVVPEPPPPPPGNVSSGG